MSASQVPISPHFVGWLGSLFFLSGLPFIPLWGVWADEYSRKAVIIRSAIVEAVVFGVIAASAAPWQLVVGMLLVGFQLGNSGVMMAAIRDVTPRHRFGLAALLSVAVAVMLALWSREVRPEVVPTGSLIRLAFGAVRGVMADPIVRWLFVVYGLVFVGRQMTTQYIVLLIHEVERTPLGGAGSIGLVLGVATIVGAGLSPLGGWIADRLGFRPVLVAAIGGIAISSAALPLAPNVTWLAVAYSVAIAFQAVVGAMVSSLLATEVPSERRSATLNLIYLPLYLGGIAGPALGATVVTAGLRPVFFTAAAVLAGSLVVAFAFARKSGRGAVAVASGPAAS